ncbi:hypothetical protein DSECCO2_197280 [anaerobic digester metagenome]
MYDYLSGYKLSEGEKEKILISCLKGMRLILRRQPIWLRKLKNKRIFERIDKIYGEKCSSRALESLVNGGFLDVENRRYVVTAKGRIAIKRGWVYKNLLWYNTGKANKYAIIISIIAILLTAAQLAYLLLSGGATG